VVFLMLLPPVLCRGCVLWLVSPPFSWAGWCCLLGGVVGVVEVYRGVLGAAGGWGFWATGAVYSFGWEFGGGVLRVGLCPGAVAEVAPLGEGRVRVVVYAVPGAGGCWEEGYEALAWALGLGEDYGVFHGLARGDPLVGCVAGGELAGWRLRSPSLWAAALVAVAQQNAGFRQGWGMLYRLYVSRGRRLRGPGGWVYVEPPGPGPGLGEAARAAGWGYRAGTLSRLAEALGGRPEALLLGRRGCGLVESVEAVRGIGRYSAALIRLLACREYGSLPLDRWLSRLAAEAYGSSAGEAEGVIRRRFGGYAGLAAMAATLCCDAEPYPRAVERLRRGLCRPGLREPSPLTLWRHTPPPSA
jgi:N-glycosylase/DNA lyase